MFEREGPEAIMVDGDVFFAVWPKRSVNKFPAQTTKGDLDATHGVLVALDINRLAFFEDTGRPRDLLLRLCVV